jgi:hypothetical protein
MLTLMRHRVAQSPLRTLTKRELCAQFLPTLLATLVPVLKTDPSDLDKVLRTLPLSEDTLSALQASHRDPDYPFLIPESCLFPNDIFPLQTHIGEVCLNIENSAMLSVLRSTLSGDWENSNPKEPDYQLAQKLISRGILTKSQRRRVSCPPPPSIQRLQHASLLLRSEHATILTDPVFEEFDDSWLNLVDLPKIDAVIISHSHNDHFSPLTLMQLPRETIIVVPKVERCSLLCEDMAVLLRAAGFENVIEAAWGSTVQIKDIRIHVYPFYGEQPWINFPSPIPALRNMGNTYLVDIGGFKTWILIDSGPEYDNSMLDVCQQVKEDVGEVHLVISNLREFPWHPGQIDSTGRYLFCFPLEKLKDFSSWPHGKPMTSGPQGIHDIMLDLEARYFLPYAHWWHQPSTQSHLVDGRAKESEMVRSVDEIRSPSLHAQTKAHLQHWQVGDTAIWNHQQSLTVVPW